MNEPRNLRKAYVEKLRACEISLKERIYDTTIRSFVFNLCAYDRKVSAREQNTVILPGAHFLIADTRTIYCSQYHRSYERNRIDALLEVGL